MEVEVAVVGSRPSLIIVLVVVDDDDDDVELHLRLRCRVDILGTNCDQCCLSMVQCCFTSTD